MAKLKQEQAIRKKKILEVQDVDQELTTALKDRIKELK